MKRTITLLFVLFSFGLLLFSQIPTDGLVAYYPFNGNAIDESGNNYDATPSGAVLTLDKSGIANSAYLFDGDKDYIQMSEELPITDFPLSVSVWIKPNAYDPDGISYIYTSDDWDHYWGNYQGFCLSMRADSSIYANYGGGVPKSHYFATPNGLVNLDEWYHIVAIYKNSTDVDIYINGDVKITTDYNPENNTVTFSGVPDRIGYGRDGLNRHSFNGVIDELAIYDRAISESEIQMLFNANTGINEGIVINECEGLKMTEGFYNETHNLNDSVQAEYGTGYTVADWVDLKAIADMDAWISCMQLEDNQSFNILVNGEQIYNGDRQYFMRYCSDGDPGATFLIHDQIGSYIFLGSWTGSRHVLAKKVESTVIVNPSDREALIQYFSNANTLVFDNFDDGDYTNNPEWTVFEDGTASVPLVESVSGDNKLKIARGTDNNTSLILQTPANISDNNYYISYETQGFSGDSYDRGYVTLFDDSDKWAYRLYVDPFGNQVVFYSFEYDELGDIIESNPICHKSISLSDIEHVFELMKVGDVYSIFLDGVFMDSSIYNNTDQWHDNITKIEITSHGSGGSSGVYWDDIIVKSLTDAIEENQTDTIVVNDITVDEGQEVIVPITVNNITSSDNIISYQFDIGFDNTAIEYSGYDLTGTIAEGGTVEVNTAVDGKLSVSYMTSIALSGSGNIINLQFNPLKADITDITISNAYLNNTTINDLANGIVIVKDVTPPTAALTYDDTENRCGDELLITATFNEPLSNEVPVQINFSGALPTSETMTRVSETVYTLALTIPEADGEVTVSLSWGTDLWGNEVTAMPLAGGSFSIIPVRLGDVDDDGLILAYDAALTLQYSIGLDPLPVVDPIPWENWRDTTANVDGVGDVTANDAGMILQYSIGKITAFDASAKKSISIADVTVEVVDTDIVFYSSGELIGLNVSAVNENSILSEPVDVADGYLSAKNINGITYKVGLCTSTPALEGDVLMKIPFNANGSITFDMIVNTVEKSVTVDLVTGVIDFGLKGIKIYPNPTSEILNIEGLQNETIGSIYNANGQMVSSQEIGAENSEINVSGLPAGLYILKMMIDDEVLVKRFTKE